MTPTTARKERPYETDVGYANARLRGMRSYLLNSTQYQALVEAPDVPDVIQVLMGTPYEPDLEEQLVHGRTAAVVDEALKNNMVRSYRKVQSFLDPKSRKKLETVLGRWDLFNIKTVLRGIHSHCASEEIRDGLIPAGVLTPVELDELAKIQDIGVLIDTLAMWGVMYAVPLRRVYREYLDSGNLADLELAVDRAYSEWAASRLKGRSESSQVARRILGMQVDVLNLVTVLRMLKEDTTQRNAKRYFLEGGRYIHEDLYLQLAELSDVDEVLDVLKRTPYGEALDEAATRYLERASISVFERALEQVIMRATRLAGLRDPQGVGLSISYLYGKQNEVTNLRIIVKGKEVGMPAERVTEELIRV